MGKTRTPIGAFIHTTWGNLQGRCRNGKYRQDTSRNASYAAVDIAMTRDEFKAWCLEMQDHILSLDRPSLDRIDKAKHYTIDNIQVIELAMNIRKDKTVFNDALGVGRCYACRATKPTDSFASDKRRLNGKSSICKECDNSRGVRRAA